MSPPGPLDTYYVTEVAIPSDKPLERVATELSAALGIAFTEHDSMYRGWIYYLAEESDHSWLGKTIYLSCNRDVVDGTPEYEEAADCAYLVRVDYPPIEREQLVRSLSEALGVPCRLVWPPR